MKKELFLGLLIVLMSSTISFAYYDVPDPMDNFAYFDCPTAVQIPAVIGKYLFMVPGIIIGGVSGLIAAPFSVSADEAIFDGLYFGAMGGNIIGSTIFGAPGYGIYRLFNWDGCVKKETK
jgi:hypothetical protein